MLPRLMPRPRERAISQLSRLTEAHEGALVDWARTPAPKVARNAKTVSALKQKVRSSMQRALLVDVPRFCGRPPRPNKRLRLACGHVLQRAGDSASLANSAFARAEVTRGLHHLDRT